MQAYERRFAEVYDRRWGAFAAGASPPLEAYLSSRVAGGVSSAVLLDLCCGTGQMAAFFLGRGWKVRGVDLSPHMIAHAARNNSDAVDAGRASFVVQDAAALDLGIKVTAAVSLYDALNHLESLKRLGACLKRVRAHLDPGGVFVFDLNTRRGLERWNGMDVREDDEITLITRGVYEAGMERAWTRISGFLRDEVGHWQPFSQTVYNTAFGMSDVRDLAGTAGFRGVRVTTLDALRGVCEDPESLNRAFFVCEA